MLGFWNRKEVYSGNSMKKSTKVRDILAENGINYSYKVVNRNTESSFDTTRARMGSSGGRSDLDYEYLIYVHKNDYDATVQIIYEE
ncbi:hypothetical protein ACQPU1_06185 [Clostridium paraputrificum]|uniref:hypothetical protein n=1 Tax=Clostridium paraputrificum TaxID=29363 RepID=UPI003D32AC34